jgi:hypothetical protein
MYKLIRTREDGRKEVVAKNTDPDWLTYLMNNHIQTDKNLDIGGWRYEIVER